MKRSLVALVATSTLVLSACGSSSGSDSAGSAGGRLSVSAAFYPLAYAVERVGGDHVTLANLTRPGAEPHDVELTPKDVLTLRRADLVVYEKGFQPAVDEAVAQVDAKNALDVSTAVDLTLAGSDDGHDHGAGGASTEDDHADEKHAEGTVDPHFWLDPTRYAGAAQAIADRLAAADPANATAYKENADAFIAELTALDEEVAAGLKNCTQRDLVTAHAAFAYLADRYDLHQVSIAGLSPDAEPDAAAMKEIVEHIAAAGVTTVYAETLVSKNLTETIAREAGATVAVLDPIEGLSDASAGSNYLEIMRANLATLEKGQGCT